MPESTRTVNRWTPTRKAAVIVELLRGGDAVELARKHGLSQA
jgi:transposase-like protein